MVSKHYQPVRDKLKIQTTMVIIDTDSSNPILHDLKNDISFKSYPPLSISANEPTS